MNPKPSLDFMHAFLPVIVAVAFIACVSLLREPKRRQFSALMIAGAGTTYFGAGFGIWEIVFCAVMMWIAFRALDEYRYAGIGWVLHVGWDVLHHLYGRPILPFLSLSSAGCAICDSVIAVWYFRGAPSLYRSRSTGAHKINRSQQSIMWPLRSIPNNAPRNKLMDCRRFSRDAK